MSFRLHSELISDAALPIDYIPGAKIFLLTKNLYFFPLVFVFKSGCEYVWLQGNHSERFFFPAQKHFLVHLGPWAEPPMSASEDKSGAQTVFLLPKPSESSGALQMYPTYVSFIIS